MYYTCESPSLEVIRVWFHFRICRETTMTPSVSWQVKWPVQKSHKISYNLSQSASRCSMSLMIVVLSLEWTLPQSPTPFGFSRVKARSPTLHHPLIVHPTPRLPLLLPCFCLAFALLLPVAFAKRILGWLLAISCFYSKTIQENSPSLLLSDSKLIAGSNQEVKDQCSEWFWEMVLYVDLSFRLEESFSSLFSFFFLKENKPFIILYTSRVIFMLGKSQR